LTPTATAAATAFDHFINTMPTHKKVMMRHFQADLSDVSQEG
jgi:hypothetical protein